MVNFVIGDEVHGDYAEFLKAELAMDDSDPYGVPELSAIPAAQRKKFKVVIVGAGMSGMLAGIRLQEAGIPFEIVETPRNVAGTWYQNTYPGCRVDSPNHTYSYSFRPNDWPQFYSQQEVLRQYFDKCVDDYGLRKNIRFNTEVKTCTYDEAKAQWRVVVEKGGKQETLDGERGDQRGRPVESAEVARHLPGQDRFKGISFHSTEWEHQHDLTGKRVLVIGTGASAFQFAPEVAKVAKEVVIFQRTPPWVSMTPEYHENVPEGKHWLLNHVPYYAKWYRFAMFWRMAEGILAAVQKDPSWNDQKLSISAKNDELRKMFTQILAELAAKTKSCSKK